MAVSTKDACEEWTVMLHGYLDNELDVIHTMEFEKHLRQCPACASELERLKGVKTVLGGGQARWDAPEAVRLHILQTIRHESMHVRNSNSQRSPGFFARVARLLGVWGLVPSAAALAASAFMFFSVPTTDSVFRDQILSSHVRSMLADHLVDVQTSDQHTVKPWFNGKLDFSPPVVDLSSAGFPLIGGRIDYLANRSVAALVYRRHGHVINVFIWPSNPAPKAETAREGYNIEVWSAGGLSFWAVSDLSQSELASFKQLYANRSGF